MKKILKRILGLSICVMVFLTENVTLGFCDAISDVSGNMLIVENEEIQGLSADDDLIGVYDSTEDVEENMGYDFQETTYDTNVYTYKPYNDATYLLEYSYFEEDIEIIGYIGEASGTLAIPQYIDEHPVTKIGFAAFERSAGFTGNLVIPEGVTEIDAWAFGDCSGLTGDLIIPDSVTSIGSCAFCGCTGFTGSLTISKNLTKIEQNTFGGCYYLSGELIIPDGIEIIGVDAFVGDSNFTGELVIPDSVTYIGDRAFMECRGFSLIVIPENCVYAQDAFVNCNCSGGILEDKRTTYPWTYIVDNNEATICGYEGDEEGDIIIPDKIGDLTVTGIGESVFVACKGFNGELVIPDSIKSIGAWAFGDCSGLTGDLIIPDSVISIGECAFCGCTGFTGSLTISKNITEIRENTFGGCSNLSGDLIIPEGVTTIGINAFVRDSGFNGDLVISNSVNRIEKFAFCECYGFTGELYIPDGTLSIEDRAFCDCYGFTSISVSQNTALGEIVFDNCTEKIEYREPCTYTLNYSVQNNEATIMGYEGEASGDLIIPNYIGNYPVTAIRDDAFTNQNGFTGNLKIGKYVTKIGESAFSHCTGLTGQLVLPKSLTSIGNLAFTYCEGFTGNLNIPSSVTSIGESVFDYCNGIEKIVNESSIDIPVIRSNIDCYWIDELTKETISQINNGKTAIRCVNLGGYEYSDSLTLTYSKNLSDNSVVITGYIGYLADNVDLVIPSEIAGYSVVGIGENAFSGSSDFSGGLVIADSIVTIGERAFWNCNSFKGTLTLGNGLTSIGIFAFGLCNGFTGDLIIPDSVVTIGERAFWECSGFNGKLSLSNRITEISDGAFMGCSGLGKKLVIPDSVQRIGEGAFCRCEGLTGDLIIPNSVTSLGQAAFENCCGFTGNLILSDNITVISLGAFNNCTGFSGYLHIPDNVILVDDNAFNNCWGFTGNLEIPDNVISIGKKAFSNCKGFDGNLVMSDSVTSIGEAAFEECRGLTGSLFLPDSLTLIGTAAFFWCVGLTGTVVIPERVTSMGNSVFGNCTGFDKFVNNSILDNIALPYLLYGDCWINVTTGEERVTVISAKQTVERKNAEPDSIQYYMQDSFTYSGSAIKPEIEVYDNGIRLVEKVDYTVAYKNNTGIYVLGEGEDYNTKKAPSVTITLKGNYSGKQTLYFTIMPKDISENDVVVADIAPVIAGSKAVKPTPAVTYGQKKLTNKKDYTIKYYSDPECKTDVVPKEAGTYYIKFTGKGNYTGEKVKSFTISPSDQKLVSKLTIGKIKNQPYTGSSITPALTVKDGKTPLSEGTDYTVTYQNNVEVGTATVTIIGDGEKYIGSRNITFKITGVAVSKLKVSGLSSAVYDGTEKKQSVENVVLKNANGPVKWIEKSEYDLIDDEQTKRSFAATVTYTKNVNAGTAMMVFTGVNMYTGTLKKTFKITAYDIKADADNAVSVTLDKAEYEYSKAGVKPETTITFGDTTLVKGKDYTVSYSNNTVLSGNPKKIPAVKIKGKGNFIGSLTKEFVIGRKSFESSEIKISVSDKSYSRTGGNWKASVSVTDNGKKLSAGKEYEKNIVYTYDTIPEGGKIYDGTFKKATPEITRNPGDDVGAKDIVPAGTVIRATVMAKGNYYTASKSKTYRVIAQDINKLSISVKNKEYTGREVKLNKEDITFKKNKYGDVTFEFVENTYSNNIKKGKATVVIEGTGNYGGRKTITFNIGVRKILWLRK